jgi:hypothetical protein
MDLAPPRGTADLYPPRSEALLELEEEAHRLVAFLAPIDPKTFSRFSKTLAEFAADPVAARALLHRDPPGR